jgi:putative transposase
MKLKTYKYRLYPNKTQEVLLNNTLEICRQIYNKCLEERKTSYEKTGVGVKATAQMKNLERFEIENLKSVHSQVIQDAVWRLDSAFDNFFRRVKKGENEVGYPRFKSYQRYDSFCFPQGGFKLLDDKKHLKISKIGSIKIKFHRDFNSGVIKNLLIKKDSLGRFYACFVLEEKEYISKEKTEIKSKIGLDLGCIDFVTTSDGNKIKHPKYYKKSEKELKKIQNKYYLLKMLPKEDKKKIKAKKKLSKLHTKIKNQRDDFLHKLSREFVNEFDLICVEDLNIKKMVSGDNNYRNLNKSILDGGWRQFLDYLSYKAEEAGKTVMKVNPAYTSQICSACGVLVKKTLSERVHSCSCGFTIDRDTNASRNILSLGTKLYNDKLLEATIL